MLDDITDAAGPLRVDGADKPDLSAVFAVQHQTDRIDIPDLELALIELVCGAPAAIAPYDIDIEPRFLEPAALGCHHHTDAAALGQPGHVVGDFFLGESRAGETLAHCANGSRDKLENLPHDLHLETCP